MNLKQKFVRTPFPGLLAVTPLVVLLLLTGIPAFKLGALLLVGVYLIAFAFIAYAEASYNHRRANSDE